MEVNAYFFDTYALHEIVAKNPDYAEYAKNVRIVTTKLNLMELYYGLLMESGEEAAEQNYSFFQKFAIEVDDALIKQSMKFKAFIRSQNRKSNLSYIDAVGYIAARQRSIKFLTGDKEFRNLENVEFVK